MGFTIKQTAQSGFSLMELIVAIAILGLLAAVSIPAYLRIAEGARKTTANENIKVFKNLITQFNLDVGSYPRALKELTAEGKPTDEGRKARWRGPYLENERIDDDPWGNPYVYRPTPGQKYPYELYSHGSGGEEATKEDRIGIYNK